MGYHIEITANDAERTVVYSADVDDFDLTEGSPLVIKVGRSVNFSGEGELAAKVAPAKKRRFGRGR